MKKILFCIIVALLSVSVVTAQDFKKVQVTLKNGQVFKGKSGTLTSESVSFLSSSGQKTFSLGEVNLVQTKEGKAGKWALGMGGGCLGLCVITIAASGSEVDAGTYTYGQLIGGSVIWVAIFTGAGYLIGNATDHWNNAYISKGSAMLKNFNLNIGPSKYAKCNVGFTYRF